ncbi:MAG: NUDIX hydrolase [Chloroflexi bacterium]|nr:NUDIX hydrolase [Chloroflexota bacterium]
MDTYCRYCSTKLQFQLVEGHNRAVCPACGFVAFRNPVAVALMIAQREGKILLVQRGVEPLKGFWSPPGGHIEWDESVEEAAVRETFEETGIQVRSAGLWDVFSQAHVGKIAIVYSGEIIGGKLQAGDDAVDVGFFDLKRPLPQPSSHQGTLLDVWYLSILETIWLRDR